MVDLIRRKRDGETLSDNEIAFIARGAAAESIPLEQLSAWLMAAWLRGLSLAETRALTLAMRDSGEKFSPARLGKQAVDKHSTGGVGDKTSFLVAPIVAACGLADPMISGRALGHTGGTLDKLEAIPGFSVNLSVEKFRRGVEQVGLCLIGQTDRIAPADKKLYALRDVTGTVESIGLITASIMSKKLAEGIDALVMDVKTGRGAFMKTLEDSRALARGIVATGGRMGKRVTAMITGMDQPLGWCAGNAIEVEESIRLLRGQGAADLTLLSIELAAEMIRLAGLAKDMEEGRLMARAEVSSGRALERLVQCIEFQGGDPRVVDDLRRLPQAARTHLVKASGSGWVTALDAERVGMAVVLLGGGRLRKEDSVDPAVGVRLHRKIGDPVQTGEILAEILYNDENRLAPALERVEAAFDIQPERVAPPALIRERIE